MLKIRILKKQTFCETKLEVTKNYLCKCDIHRNSLFNLEIAKKVSVITRFEKNEEEKILKCHRYTTNLTSNNTIKIHPLLLGRHP